MTNCHDGCDKNHLCRLQTQALLTFLGFVLQSRVVVHSLQIFLLAELQNMEE